MKRDGATLGESRTVWRSAAADGGPHEVSWRADVPSRCECPVENRCDGDLDRGLRGRHVLRDDTQCARVRSTFVRQRMVVTAQEQRYQREDDTEKHPSAPPELPPPLHTRTGGYRRWRPSSNRRRAGIVRLAASEVSYGILEITAGGGDRAAALLGVAPRPLQQLAGFEKSIAKARALDARGSRREPTGNRLKADGLCVACPTVRRSCARPLVTGPSGSG